MLLLLALSTGHHSIFCLIDDAASFSLQMDFGIRFVH